MRCLVVSAVLGTLVLALSLTGQVVQATERYPLGHVSQYFSDPQCPNPDSFHVYIVYGNQSGETDRQYAGYTSYWCTGGVVNGTFAYSPYWQQCENYYGGSCPPY